MPIQRSNLGTGAVRFRGSLVRLRIDPRFTKVLEEQLEVLQRNAAREWLRAIVLSNKVRVYSGESLGSIKWAQGTNGNLARYLNVAIPINAPHPRPHKNERTGTSYYNFANTNHTYRFLFRSNVLQFILNEFTRDAIPPSRTAPWRSLQVGQKAYEVAIIAGIKRLPKIKDFLLKEAIGLST